MDIIFGDIELHVSELAIVAVSMFWAISACAKAALEAMK